MAAKHGPIIIIIIITIIIITGMSIDQYQQKQDIRVM